MEPREVAVSAREEAVGEREAAGGEREAAVIEREAALRQLEEELWRDVSLPWKDGPLLLTIGTGWLDGMATDACGNIYIADYGATIIYRISPDGQTKDKVISGAGFRSNICSGYV